MKTHGLLLVGLLWLLLPHAVLALDAETQRLEAEALCQAMPYRCAPPPTDPVHVLCDSLTPHMALIASKRLHHEALDAADWDAEQTWKTSCLEWDKQQRQAREAEAQARALPRSSTTIDCVTTSSEGRWSSRVTTTCTSH
jgi:hypothetical protein